MNKNVESSNASNKAVSSEMLNAVKKLYEEQQKNIDMGLEIFGITEKINPIDVIPVQIQNYELDYEISEIPKGGKDGKACVMRQNEYKNRVPEPSSYAEISKLSFVKDGLIKADEFRLLLKAIPTFKGPSDHYDLDVEHLSEENTLKLHIGLKILTDKKHDLFVYGMRTAKGKRVLRIKEFDFRVDMDLKAKWGWTKEYVHLVLKKKNVPFKKPLTQILTLLKVRMEDVGYAQLKEALPTTLQSLSIVKPSISELLHVSKNCKNFKIGNFDVFSEPLKIGDLEGNKFRIALRGITATTTNDQINNFIECLEFLKGNGFINYYGDKRFLNKKAVPVYQIGKALLTRNNKTVIDLVMKPSKDDPTNVKAFKERWILHKGNIEKTLQGSEDIKAEFEYKVVMHLKENTEDYAGAVDKIPFNFRLGYVFAYQSYIWNVIASQRFKRKGLKLYPGDIVLTTANNKDIPPEFYEDVSVPLMARSEPMVEVKRDPKKKPIYRGIVKFVTQEEIDDGTYTIHDLVLPLPGSEVLFPKNEVGIWYTDFLSKDDLSKTRLLDRYCINGDEVVTNSHYFLHGTYRKLIIKPQNMKWDFKVYKELNDDIIYAKGLSSKPVLPKGEEKLAIILEFGLPPDSYVNMALREILDLEKSGFSDMVQAYKRAKELEVKDKENRNKKNQSTPKIQEELKGRTKSQKDVQVKRARIEGGNRKERLDGGTRKERLDGGTRSKNIKDRLSGSARSSREPERSRRSSEKTFNCLGSREISKSSNRIEVRVLNDNGNFRRSPSFERIYSNNEPSRLPDRFKDPRDIPRTIDGIPVCEYSTRAEDPISDGSDRRSLVEDNRRVWGSPSRLQERRLDYEQSSPQDKCERIRAFEHQAMDRPRQSVFDGRLEPRRMQDNFREESQFDNPRVQPGRLLEPPGYVRQLNSDDLRNRLNENVYDPEQEFERFEREVDEMNSIRSQGSDQRIRFNDHFDHGFRGRDFKDEPTAFNPEKRSHSPLSPSTIEKLRRLDEEALRLDLQRVSRFPISGNEESSNFKHQSNFEPACEFSYPRYSDNMEGNLGHIAFGNMTNNETLRRNEERDVDRMLQMRFDELQRKRLQDGRQMGNMRHSSYNSNMAPQQHGFEQGLPTGASASPQLQHFRGLYNNCNDQFFSNNTNIRSNDQFPQRDMTNFNQIPQRTAPNGPFSMQSNFQSGPWNVGPSLPGMHLQQSAQNIRNFGAHQPPMDSFKNRSQEMDIREMMSAQNMGNRNSSPSRQLHNQEIMGNAWDNRGAQFPNLSSYNSVMMNPQRNQQNQIFPQQSHIFSQQSQNFDQNQLRLHRFPGNIAQGQAPSIAPPGFRSNFPAPRGRGRGRV